MKNNLTIDDLAGMVQRGFKRLETQTEKLEAQTNEGFKRMDDRFLNVNARLDTIETDIQNTLVYRNEFEDLNARVRFLERKIGIESGK